MQIKAMVAPKAGGAFSWEDVDLDDPREDEILVRIKAVGLCHTDVVAQMGVFGWDVDGVYGHEGAGIVDRVGSAVKNFTPGDRVAISFRSCGQCTNCRRSVPPYCVEMPALNYAGMRPDGSRTLHRDGQDIGSNFFGQSSFATHAITYERNLVKIPEDIPFAIAAPMGCGIQTGFGSVVNSFDCSEGSSLVVAGTGIVGLSAVMAGKLRNCGTIIVVEPHAARREAALKLGATHIIDPTAAGDVTEKIREIIPVGVDFAIDTSGIPAVLDTLVNSLGSMGALGLIGITPPGTPMPGDATTIMTFGQTVRGIIEGDSDPAEMIPQLMQYYLDGMLPLDDLITTYPLTEINQAVADQHDGKCLKVVLTLD